MMREKQILKLLEVASPPIGGPTSVAIPGKLGSQLSSLLRVRDGFYAFESALHVFPSEPTLEGARSLTDWNDPEGWRQRYEDMAYGLFFFAENVLGDQFALSGEEIVSFSPETGEREALASSIGEWVDCILSDYNQLLAYPLAHEWQVINGPLGVGHRLIPKTPFVLGGEYDASNLYSIDAVIGMEVRAELATQIRDLPDGAKVRYRVIEN